MAKRVPVKIAISSYDENGNFIKSFKEVLAYTYKGLALHRPYNQPESFSWVISHISSGQAIFAFHNFKIMREFFTELADNMDFTVTLDKLSKSDVSNYLKTFKYQTW